MKIISGDELLGILRARVTEATSKASAATALGISRQYIGEVLAGKWLPGPKLLARLGYEKVTMYRRVK